MNRLRLSALMAALVLHSSANAGGNKQINEWQKAISDIGKSITERDQSGSSWIVEYNSTFAAADVGFVLAPSSYDKNSSSLNVIAKCSPTSAAQYTTEGRDFADIAANRTISFNAGVNAPPGFVAGSLASANANLAIASQKQVSFSLSDIQVSQVLESDAIDAMNTQECLRRIRHRKDVFYVRGQYLMRLIMSQSGTSTGGIGANLNLGGASPTFGFGVRWNRARDWEIAQLKPRPWFRIVSRFRRNKAGDGFALAE